MKKLLLSLFFVLNITIGCLGAAESKLPEDTIYTLVPAEYITESDDIKRENGFRVTKTQLQKLSLGLPLTMIEEKEEDGNTIINFPQVRGEILHFILSLEPHINEAGTINREGINIEIDTLLSRPGIPNRLELISECIIALSYLETPAILEVFIDKFAENAHTFDGRVEYGSSLNAIINLLQPGNSLYQSLNVKIDTTILPYLSTIRPCTRVPYGTFFSGSWSGCGNLFAHATHSQNVTVLDLTTNTYTTTTGMHDGIIHSVHWSPIENLLASASGDRTIKIWNSNTGECLRTLTGHGASVYSVSWNPNGSQVASSSLDRTIKIWNTNTGECLKTLTGKTGLVLHVQWNPKENLLASTSSDGTIKIWNTVSWKCIRTIRYPIADSFQMCPNNLCWNPEGTLLAATSASENITIWDVSNGKCIKTFQQPGKTPTSIQWNPNGQSIAFVNHMDTKLNLLCLDDNIKQLDLAQKLVIIALLKIDKPISAGTRGRFQPIYETLPREAKAVLQTQLESEEIAFFNTKPAGPTTLGEKVLRIVKHPAFWVHVSIAGGVLATVLVKKVLKR